ncbi:MAG: protein O-GlcNAcase [Balneolaceae bacterium]
MSTSCSNSEFDQVGVVEGFYGDPWSHEERLDVIRFMGEVGMNTYYYAPKDDPFHRSQWRESYAGKPLSQFSELLKVSTESDVDVYFAISPGLDIVYSDSADFEALNAKLQDMISLGVRHIALFLDDVPETLSNEKDREEYSDLAEAHVDIINRLWERLKDDEVQLVVCPTTYTSAWGSREYAEKLGEGVPAEIPLFWTGEDVAISEVTRSEAENWQNLINRKPLLWDNFPVNDFEVWRPILGPLRGRDGHLPEAMSGILANPMDIPYASMIPLYTVAKYGEDPSGYDPDEALQKAVIHLAGVEAFPHLMPIVEMYSDYGWTDNLFTAIYTPGKPLNEELLYQKLDEMEEHLSVLSGAEFSNHPYLSKLVPELTPFVEKTRNDLDKLLALDRSLVEIRDGFKKEWDGAEVKISREGDQLNAELKVTKADSRHEWILILTEYENPPETWLQPEDLIVRWKLEQDSARADHFHLTPFSRRGISDIQVRTITSFFEHFTKSSDVEIRSQKESDGDASSYKISMPWPDAERVRFNVFLNPGNTLAKQPYLGNPHTYPVLVSEN